MRKSSLLAVFTAVFLVFTTNQAAADPIRTQEEMIMVVGESTVLHDCTRSARSSELWYRIDRSWVRLAKSSVVRDSQTCKNRNMPFKHTFSFKVPAGYQSIEPAAKYTKMLLRTIGPGQMPKLFTATVYKTKTERDLATGSSGVNAISVTDWSKCLYKGALLQGRVKVVTYDANYRVQLVSQGADLVIEQVAGKAKSCGQWQFVNQNFDFSIQLVNEAADFTISIVKSNGPKK
jgi:hypothetical protein